jgi:hypothetical protein
MFDLIITWVMPIWFTTFVLGFYFALEEQLHS